MDLEELKLNWKNTNDRVDQMQHLMLQKQTRTAAGRLKRQPIFELIVAAATLIWSGNFVANNFSKILRSPAEAIPVAVLYALGIFNIWLSMRQFVVVSTLDFSQPVVETQKKIAFLRRLRARSTQYAFLIGLPLWVIFPLVAGQAAFGFEFIRAVSMPWILGNLAFGVAASGLILLVARRLGTQSPVLRKLDDLLAGTEIAEAQRDLAEIGKFAQA